MKRSDLILRAFLSTPQVSGVLARMFREWLRDQGRTLPLVDEMARSVRFDPHPSAYVHERWRELSARLGLAEQPRRKRNRWRWGAAAAVAAVIFGVVLSHRRPPAALAPPLCAAASTAVEQGRKQHLRLADGTGVWINGDSRLELCGRREVRLEGEAFFAVNKQQESFTVQVGDVAVQVLGTEFNVSARGGSTVVSLYRGALSVRRGGQTWLMAAGQEIEFDSSGVESRSTERRQARWLREIIDFDCQPLGEVLTSIGQIYVREMVGAEGLTEEVTLRFEHALEFDQLMRIAAELGQFRWRTEGEKVIIEI